MVDNSMANRHRKLKTYIVSFVLFSDAMYIGSYIMTLLAILQFLYGDYPYAKFALVATVFFKVLYVVARRVAMFLNNILREKTSQYIVF